MIRRKSNLVESLKCVLVGDSGTGKSSLIMTFSTGKFPSESELQTMHQLDSQSANTLIGNRPVNLEMWDTVASEDCDTLRPLTYENTSVFLVLFDVTDMKSYESVRAKWVPEIRDHQPESPVILVGTKSDLREDIVSRVTLSKTNIQFISSQQGCGLAREMQADNYFECSALQNNGLKQLFDEVVKCGMVSAETQSKSTTCMCPCWTFV